MDRSHLTPKKTRRSNDDALTTVYVKNGNDAGQERRGKSAALVAGLGQPPVIDLTDGKDEKGIGVNYNPKRGVAEDAAMIGESLDSLVADGKLPATASAEVRTAGFADVKVVETAMTRRNEASDGDFHKDMLAAQVLADSYNNGDGRPFSEQKFLARVHEVPRRASELAA